MSNNKDKQKWMLITKFQKCFENGKDKFWGGWVTEFLSYVMLTAVNNLGWVVFSVWLLGYFHVGHIQTKYKKKRGSSLKPCLYGLKKTQCCYCPYRKVRIRPDFDGHKQSNKMFRTSLFKAKQGTKNLK
jgi:hypothetical protein